ncbi:MAG: hypothetical protein HQK76_06225 [Desulfobacterales bacterium]|nr:hypothetical protein [Desulfobacterales bacterium]
MGKIFFYKNFLFLCLAFVLFLSYSNNVFSKEINVLVLTDAAGLGDKGFNDVCWQGVTQAKKDFNINAHFSLLVILYFTYDFHAEYH